ncbi:hypothetical protein [Streptomyces odonnellii]|uniref:hypothetical protein n=1 Tax=Streptomyces odonnellii TaxID=1417980 RepID=UPI000626D9F1|nr:hypothetical protein [Streptomyces odonnellii]
MAQYKNENTGDIVTLPTPRGRLERLANWTRLDPDPEPSAPAGPVRPSKSAKKEEWVSYARTRTQTAEDEAKIDGLTRDELIAQYGDDGASA